MHGLNTIVALNKRAQEAHDAAVAKAAPRYTGPAVSYVSYEWAPVRESAAPVYGVGEMERCTSEEATAWGVYGRRADGTAAHIADCVDEDSADSAVALLNALRRETAAAPPAAAPYTFVDELRDTLSTLDGAPNLTPYERQLLAYTKILLQCADAEDLHALAPVFPLEVR